MIIGIEGTGSQGWGNDDLMRTFVRRILHQTTIRPASYFIGPAESGSDGPAIVEGAHQALKNGHHNKPVVLVGYSRGAAYCMYIAEQAKKWGGQIDLLIMFDSVARQKEFTVPDAVPGNVRKVIHAYRDPRAGSRHFFSNVGLSVASRSTTMEKEMFFGSHGAIGGVSWDAAAGENPYYAQSTANTLFGAREWAGKTMIGQMTIGGSPTDREQLNVPRQPVVTKAQDDACVIQVGAWMWERLAREGAVPSAKNAANTAPAFSGSRTPGVRNMVT